MKLFDNPDGANFQAQAVLACIRQHSGIEHTWNKDELKYDIEPEVERWFNCREQGYVIYARTRSKQLNIAFFEHRNSDSICAVKWEGYTINPPTINDIPESHPFCNSKYNVDYSVCYGKFIEMAEWIIKQLNQLKAE